MSAPISAKPAVVVNMRTRDRRVLPPSSSPDVLKTPFIRKAIQIATIAPGGVKLFEQIFDSYLDLVKSRRPGA